MPQPNEFMLKKEEAEDKYQRKLTAGTNITIDPVTNEISAAGGGSTVTYSGTYSYGDSLGALTINGNVSQIKTPNLVPGNNVNITRDAQTGAITISSTGGDDANVEPNPDGEPTDTLSTLGVDGEIIDYYLQEGLIGTSSGSYVTCNLDKNLVEDEYIAVITDADETQYVKTFEYDGTNNVTIQWTDSGKSFTLVITSTTAGLTSYSGSWRDIYCDIYTKSYGQIIYEVGGDKRGLEYFKETPTSLYGESVLSVMTDPRFVFDDQVSATFRAQGGTHTWSVQAGVTTGIAQTHVIRSLSANTWQGIFQMSDDPSELGIYYKFVKDNWWDVDSEGTMTWDNCPNAMIYPCSSNVNAYGFKDSFEKDGKTYYLIIIGSNQIDFTTSRVGTYAASTLYLPSYDGTQTAEHGYYRTLGEFGNYLLTTSESFYYNGLSMDKKLAFFAGGEDENGTDAPIKIYADGTAEGLVTKHDFDNADFTGASSSENGAHGLVPQPLIADKDKFLKGDGTWAEETDAIEELTDVNLTSLADGQILKYNSTTQKWENANESGGSEVEANPSDPATDTLNTIGIDGTVYNIAGGGGGGNALIMDAQIYSLDEQVVGVWTDNKPLYQKTISFGNLPNNSEKTFAHNISNVDNIWVIGGYVTTGTKQFELEHSSSPISNNWTCNVDATNVTIETFTDRSGLTATVTVQYTKTTDIAGSGGYQAYGFSPVIYSTEEREIGVWHDGKPLYRKMFDFTSSPISLGSSWVTTPISSSDIDKVVTVRAFHSDGTVYEEIDADPTRSNHTWVGVKGVGTAYYLMLEYTKLSDVAGSGKYNTLGVPNVPIYTLSERVLGLNNYTLNLTHSDGTVITQTITSSDQIVNFEITKPGIWTLSNTKDSYTKTYTINTTSDIFAGSIVSIIPILSNNTGSNGVAIAPSSSPNYGDGNAWWAFDNSFSTELEYLGEGQRNAYVGYIFNNDVYIDNLKAWMGNYSNSNDFSIQLQITLDGSTWTTINTFKVAGYSDGTYGEFDYDLRQIVRGFRYYSSTLKNGGQNWKTYEIQAWGSEL